MFKSIKLRDDGLIEVLFAPRENPKLSASGKTRILAGTGGFIETDLDIEGLGTVSLNANLTVENTEYVKPVEPLPERGPVERRPDETPAPPPRTAPVLRAVRK